VKRDINQSVDANDTISANGTKVAPAPPGLGGTGLRYPSML